MVYIVARLQIKYGRLPEFYKIHEELIGPSVMSDNHRLVVSYKTVVGASVCELLNIYEVDDVNAFLGFTKTVDGSERFSALTERLKDVIEQETLTLVSKTPYSP